MKDLMGQAIWDYYHQERPQDMLTETNLTSLDVFPTEYLFRDYDGMEPQEQKAMDLAHGRVLDIGAGAGAHALFLQNEKGLDVTALDISPKSIEVCKLRGVKHAVCGSLLDFDGSGYDTILLLMNGTGIFEKFDKIDIYLQKLISMLNPGGQILVDGTDIIYMYRDKDGNFINPPDRYYGEVVFKLYYKGEMDDPFEWLYLDYPNLEEAAENNGLKAEAVFEEEYNYLARLS